MAEGVRRIALTIAGSDSGGGAGIQADLKTFQAFGCFGTTAIVAVTAQNTLGVRGVHQVPLEMISAQLDALAVDLPPDALKTGMLATRDVVERVADEIGARGWGSYVLDPVMVASSGDRLLDVHRESIERFARRNDLLHFCLDTRKILFAQSCLAQIDIIIVTVLDNRPYAKLRLWPDTLHCCCRDVRQTVPHRVQVFFTFFLFGHIISPYFSTNQGIT